MAAEFNPYHVWLGIPPEDQPANHYRLLSLRLFENDGDVIDSAADRQTAHLRTFQSGKHGNLTQRLLNEVAAARVCLLDSKKRAAYDQQLRAALAASAPPSGTTAQPAPGGSAIQRQPPRRPTATEAAPPSTDPWSDLLGDPSAKPTRAAGAKSAASAKAGAAKKDAKNRMISIGIAAGVVLIAGVAFGIYSMSGSGAGSEGTLVFDWPDRTDVAVKVDGAAIEVPASGTWEHNFAAGAHHVTAQRPAFKLAADVNLDTGQRLSVPADWKPKALLVLSWPAALRSGAVLKIDGRVQSVSQHEPLEVPVEPGRHTIQITRTGFDPINTSAVVAADGRELVAVAAPPAEAKLVFDWPAGDRQDAELVVDGSSRTIADGSDSEPFALKLEPGRHVVQITRRGFEPFNQAVDLSAGSDSQIKPTWTPEKKIAAAPTVAETTAPAEAAPAEPVKKLPVPAAAEQEKIAKQLNELYKTSQPGPKDPAKAQELYDVAAKDGSSPGERYMLLMKGAEIAAMAGDLNLSLQGIDALDADYDLDALEAKQKLLEKFIAAGKPDQVAIAIPTAEQLVDQAVAADRFDIAVVLATTASKAVAKSKIATHKEDEDRLSRRRHDIHLLEPIHAAAKKAQETLEKTPADADANLTVGRWLCFYKGDWTTGLPMLARGSDEKLKALAEQEIKSPTDADQQAQLADAWWDLAQKEAGIARDSLHLHAGNIYQEAMPNLASALKKAAIEKRFAEIADLKTPLAAISTTKSAGAVTFPLGQWVDVLRLVDVDRDRVKGVWTRNGTEVSVASAGNSRLCLPIIVDGGYDFEQEFTRSAGSGDVVTMLTIGSHACAATLSGWAGAVSGLMNVDGREPIDPSNPITIRPGTLENGQRYRLVISVRLLAHDQAAIDVSLDGKRYLPHWEGARSALGEFKDWALPESRRLGFGAENVTFHSAKLRMVSGTASAVASVQGSAPSQFASPIAVSDKSSGASRFPSVKGIDLLAPVNVDRDTTKGHWTREGRTIVSDDRISRIVFPTEISEAGYEYWVEFSRDRGDDCLIFSFPVGDKGGSFILSNYHKYSGLELIDGQSTDKEVNPTARSTVTLTDGQRYVARIVVNVQGENAEIHCFLDRDELVAWKGKVGSLSYSDLAQVPLHRAGFCESYSPTTIHRARLLKSNTSAGPQRAPRSDTSDASAGTMKFPLGQFVEVLQLVDPAKHAVAGRWSRVEDKIKVEPDNQSRIVIPVAVAGSYDLEVELNRHDGAGDLHTTLPVGSHSCDVSIGQDGHVGGLESIDNRRAFDKANPITANSPVFENDHTYHLLAKVRVSSADHASIDVLLDGKPYLPHWEGDPATLSVSKDWAMPTVDHLGLGAWRSQVTYSSVKLRMISGHATDDPASAGAAASSEPPTIIKARWGRRKTWIDVTAVVKEAVDKGEVVYANSGFLKVDPTQGKKKQLQITYKLGETEQATNINEGGKWSKDDYGKPPAE